RSIEVPPSVEGAGRTGGAGFRSGPDHSRDRGWPRPSPSGGRGPACSGPTGPAPCPVIAFASAMRFDRYTIKSQEALERAQRLASERGHQELQPEHLLSALLDDAEGTTASVLEKLGVSREPLARAAELA